MTPVPIMEVEKVKRVLAQRETSLVLLVGTLRPPGGRSEEKGCHEKTS
jgi:hypothetical protein